MSSKWVFFPNQYIKKNTQHIFYHIEAYHISHVFKGISDSFSLVNLPKEDFERTVSLFLKLFLRLDLLSNFEADLSTEPDFCIFSVTSFFSFPGGKVELAFGALFLISGV